MSEPFKAGQKVLIEGEIVDPGLNERDDYLVAIRRGQDPAFTRHVHYSVVRPMPPEPDERCFRVRNKHNSNTWIVGHVLPRLNQGFVAMTYSYDPEWATIFPPHWRPVFEADPDWEIVPINPEPEPAADPVAEAERELVEAALAFVHEPMSIIFNGEQNRLCDAAVKVKQARRRAGKERAK